MSDSNNENNDLPKFFGDEPNTTHPEWEGPIDPEQQRRLEGPKHQQKIPEELSTHRPPFFGSPHGKSILTKMGRPARRKVINKPPSLDRFKRLLDLLKKIDNIK